MKKMIYLAFALLLLSANSMNAQVAIGTTNPNMEPHTGAILDLGQVTGKNLGLLLPQVTLTDVKIWAPVVGEEGEEVEGMLVYNDNDDATIENGLRGKGAYVWYDNSWNKIGAASFICGDKLKDIDGNAYYTGDFGIAGCWMTENLKATKYADGTAIDLKSGSNSLNDKKEFAYPNNVQANKETLGLLYTWAAASGRTTVGAGETNNPTQDQYPGVCPAGWHLPSDYEWSQLEKVIADDAINKYSSTGTTTWEDSYYTSTGTRGLHGQKMKSLNKVSGQVTGGTSRAANLNGFDALLAGMVQASGGVSGFSEVYYFWTSSTSNGEAWSRGLWGSMDSVMRGQAFRTGLYGVRCKKN